MASQNESDWNDELEEEVSSEGVESLVVYSRDWTVDTIWRQIELDNIDLNPKFQRRNAWNDIKRSKLIESLIIGVPVPEIVLAEDKTKKKSFIVIDGKQRLLALAGFFRPDVYKSWESAKLKGLNTRKDLNGKTFEELSKLSDELRQLTNADIRCTVISNYNSTSVLYDIFYRLNTGSVPLSSQELRQVLNRGPFADFLIEFTNTPLPLHKVLNLNGPDNRLRDAEIILRYVSFSIFGKEYNGNLTPFLDESMAKINKDWKYYEQIVGCILNSFNNATDLLICLFTAKLVGRKYAASVWETRFNRALFEVQVYYFSKVSGEILDSLSGEQIKVAYEDFCINTPEFLESVEASTKSVQRYRSRYALFQQFINRTYGLSINNIPVSDVAGT